MNTNDLKSYQKEVFKEFEELTEKINALAFFKENDEYFLNLKNIWDEYIKMKKKESIQGAESFTLDEWNHMDELKTKGREYMLVCSQIEKMFDYRETLIERIVTWGIKREEFLYD